MKQTVEEAARDAIHAHYKCNGEYPCGERDYCEHCNGHNTALDCCECGADEFKEGFISGVEWQSKQSPWISVKERLPEKPKYDWVLVTIRDKRDGFIGLPQIGELRSDGFWHTRESDDFNTEQFRREYGTTDALGVLLHQEVLAWLPIPSFDDILEANRDVLERIKEKGD